MNARTVAVYHSMLRIADVVEHYPSLRASAAQSKAFELFKQVMHELDDLTHYEATARVELAELKRSVAAHKRRLYAALESIQAAAALLPEHAEPLPRISLPPLNKHVYVFCADAHGILRLADMCHAELVDAGMHPNKVDEARRAIAELGEAHLQCMMTELYLKTVPGRSGRLIESARKHARQLYLELRPQLQGDVRADWKRAASLGRTHRRKELPASRARPRLPAGSPASDVEPAGPPSTAGIRGLARRVVLRIVGADTPGAANSTVGDVDVHETRRLPSATVDVPATDADGAST